MNTTRRGFLGALLAASVAPAIVKADSLMKLAVPQRLVLWGDGVHDDTDAATALLNRSRDVYSPGGVLLTGGVLTGGVIKISRPVVFAGSNISITRCALRASRPMDHMIFIGSPSTRVVIDDTEFTPYQATAPMAIKA